jgi:hypothetical protein
MLSHVGWGRLRSRASVPNQEEDWLQSRPEIPDLSHRQLAWEKSQHPSEKKVKTERRAIQVSRHGPQMRTLFISPVAAPIANKFFGYSMIPR